MLRKMVLLCVVSAASVAQAGRNVVVVLDDSGSMNEQMRSGPGLVKMDVAKKSLLTVLEQVSQQAKVGVVLLNGRWGSDHWAYPLGTVDMTRLKGAIEEIRAWGGTPLGERMKTGADALLAQRKKEYYGTYRLLIVTDGEATDVDLMEAYLPDILARGIRVDVIGVDMAAEHSLATMVHNYRRADDPESLRRAITEVFAESGGGDSGTDQSDFDVIAPLPDELAGAALVALSTPENDPIRARTASLAEVLEIAARAADTDATPPDEPAPVVSDEPADVVPGEPAPVVPGEPAPVVPDEPAPDDSDFAGPDEDAEDDGPFGFGFGTLLLGGVCALGVILLLLKLFSNKPKDF